MTQRNANRLKLVFAIVCIVLILGTLPSVYLIGSGLLNGSVALAERSYFQIKLAVYLGEIVLLGLVAIFMLKTRRKTPR